MAKNVSTYIKNVGKSFGYVVGDIMKEYNPVITSIASDTKDTVEDLYSSIKPFVSSKPDLNEKTLSGTIRSTVDDSIKNVFEDLKSGNLYNKSRNKASEDALAKSFMGDLGDFDFDFDFDEDFDDEDDSISSKEIVANNDKSTIDIINAVDQVGYKVADTLGTATIESADYIVKSSKQDNKAMYALNRRGFSQITSALLSVNKSIAQFSQIGEPLTAHMQNSSVFFTRTTETLNRMDQTLQQIAKNTTPAPSATNGNYNLAKGTLSDVLGDSFSLSSYKEMIKSNIEDYKDMVSMFADMAKGMKDESTGSYGKNISLVGMGTKALVQGMIPKIFKESMKDLNEGIKNFIGASLVKSRNKSSGSIIIDLLKDAFLPKDGFKRNINTSNYNKGQVAWDGIARKALTEVIPEYLSGIYNALSGKDMVYDYNRGTFKTRSNVKNEVHDKERDYAKSAGGDFRKDALDSVDKMSDKSDEFKAQMKKEIENYFYNAFDIGDDFWDIKNFSNYQKNKFGVSDDSIAILTDLLESYKTTPGKRYRGNKYVTDVQMERDSYGNEKRREEATGTSNENYIRNGFSDIDTKSGREGLTDKFDHSSLFYLAGIYENTGYLADNIGYIGGNTKKVNKKSRLKKGKGISKISSPIEDKKPVENESVGGEKTIQDVINEYKSSTDKTNDQSFFDKMSQMGMNDDEIEKLKSEKDKKLFNDKVKDKKEGWKAKMSNFMSKFTPKALKGKFDNAFESAAGILDRINVAMTQVIWGKDGNPDSEDGFLGYLMKSTKDTFKKFSDKIDDMFPDLKNKLNKFWDSLFGAKGEDGKRHGGKLGAFRDETRKELKNSAAWMGQTVKNFFSSGRHKKKSNDEAAMDALREANGVDNAAYGRQVTKTGIVAVSEGEMIIPSELNPFYHGVTNKTDQVRKEKNAITKFYGSFAPGTASVGDKESDQKGLKQSISDFLNKKVDSSKDAERDGEGKGHEFIRKGFETLGSGFAEFFQRIGGNNDPKEIEKEKKSLNEKASTLLKEAGLNKGAIGAGAIIGGGVSLLTGAVVGPLFGAAIGGAVGLALKSEQAQKVLFGDDEGNKGLLPKKVGDFIKNQLPDVGAGTAIGAAGGLFMGSPVLGAVLGGTIGFVKSSDQAKDFLFGKKDKNNERTGGVISKKLQDKIKSAVPGISAGMIAGAVVGPFGIVGNLMVGAGVGYLATSHGFHKWMFGEDGQGGFVETLKTKIFDNLDIISRNMWNGIKARSRNLFKSLGEKVKGFFTKKAKAAANGEGGGLIGKALNLGNKVVTGTTNKIGDFLDRKRSKIVGRNLAKGYEVYDYVEDENGKRVKKTLNAAERVARRGQTNNSSINNFDKLIAVANSKEELVNLQKQLADLRNPKRALSRARNDALTGLYSDLNELDKHSASKIGKLVSSGKYDQALKMVDKLGLSPDTVAKYKESINNAKSGLDKASDVKGAKDNIIRALKQQGIDASKAGDLENMQDYINEEIKQRFSDEKVAEKKEEDYKSKITNFLDSIRENTEIIASGKTKKLDSSTVSAKDIIEKNSDDAMDALREANGVPVDNSDSEPKSKVITTAFGDQIKMTTNSQGESVPDIRDSSTKESLEASGEIKKSIKAIPVIGTAVGGMQGFFGSIKEKLFGEEKKPGLLGTIKNLLSGETSGPLSYLFNLISGSKLGTIGKGLKTLASKVTLEGVLVNVVGPALLGEAFFGKFDDLFKRFGWGGSNKDTDITYNKETGEQYTKDENGNLVDSEGNIVDQSQVEVGVRSGDTKSFSDSLKYNTVRGALTGTKSLASVVLGKTVVGKGIKKAASNVSTALLSKDNVAALAAKNNLVDTILDGCTKLTEALRKIPALSGMADNIDNLFTELADKVSQKLASESAKNIANLAKNAVVWAKIAFIAIDFTTGYEDARSTLGITQKPTVGQKIISGILRAAKNFIPVIGTLIPDNVLVDLICDYVAPALGLNPEELKKQREEAQAEVDAYNQEHGTDYDVQQYNKTVLKDYTWTERIGNATKTTWNDTKTKVTNFTNSVKENGLGATLKNGAANAINTFKDSYADSGGGILGIQSALGDTIGNMLPGVLGEVVKKNAEIKKLANKGELGNMWKVSLSDFSSDTSKGEAEVGIFSKIIGQIPLVYNKVMCTPIALLSKVGNAIKDFFKPIIEDVKYLNDLPAKVRSDTEQKMYQDDFSLSDFMDVSEYEKSDSGSIFNGLIRASAIQNRLLTLPIMAFKRIGRGIKNTFDKVTEPVKNSISALSTAKNDIDAKVKAGDVTGLINSSIDDSDDAENPVGGFTNAIYTTMKIMNVPKTALSWVGHQIGDGIKELIGNSKTNYSIMSNSIDAIKKFADDGDMSSVWKTELKLENEELDPISGIWKAGFGISKAFQVIIAAFNKFIAPILDGIENVKDLLEEKVSDVFDDAKDKVSDTAKGGLNTVGKAAGKIFDGAKSWLTGGGSGNGFVSQFDSKYKDIKYADSTVSEKGCAPAVATMVASKYGKKYGMDQAIKDSTKYQNKEGTSIDYFKAALGAQGISTNYIQGANSAQQITQALANGNQVILLGRDTNNTSKDASPFGPNNHYVVATGLDKNGNLIINDPESDAPKTYSANILKFINAGIDTSSSGSGGNYDTDIARKTWGYFTSKGYSPAATAGIMGNMYQESGMDPTRHQNGGPAAGIVQWEKFGVPGTRWAKMQDFANANGYNWSDLDPQLQYVDQETQDLGSFWKNTSFANTEEFKAASDPMLATEGFEKAFERANPDKCNMPRRKEAAEAYYQLYEDSAYTGNYSADSPSGDVSTVNGSSDSSSSSSSSGFAGILSAITSAFSKIGELFTGSSDSSNDSSTGISSADGTTAGGDVTLGPIPEGKGNDAQKKIVQYAESILGRDQYSQDANLRTKVGQGYSDCSSFAQWAYKNAINVDPGSNTGAIIDSPLLTTVDEGSTPDVNKLEAGDLLLFKSAKSNGRTKNVGHVEIYDGNGNVIGHGSGVGPTKKSLESYLNTRNKMGAPYIEARRYNDIASLGGSSDDSTSSGLINSTKISKGGVTMSAAGSGLRSAGVLLSKKPSFRNKSNNESAELSQSNRFANRTIGKSNRFTVSGAGSETDLASKSTNMLNNIKTQVQNNSSGISTDLVQRLIESITNVLNMIANNTAPIEQIYTLLSQYTGKSAESTAAQTGATVGAKEVENNNSNPSDTVSNNISNLAGVLAEIARG